MTTTGQDMIMYQGEAKQIEVTITGLSAIAGLSAEYAMWGEDELKVQLAGSDVALSDEDDTIKATIDLDNADTAALEAGDYEHQLTLVDSDGDRAVVMEGTVTIKARRTEL